MRALLAKYWWVALVRGIVAIAFGLMAIGWPALTLATLVIFFGARALVTGVFLVAGSFAGRAEGGDWWFMAFPAAGVLALVWFIAAFALLFGTLHVVLALRLKALGAGRAAAA